LTGAEKRERDRAARLQSLLGIRSLATQASSRAGELRGSRIGAYHPQNLENLTPKQWFFSILPGTGRLEGVHLESACHSTAGTMPAEVVELPAPPLHRFSRVASRRVRGLLFRGASSVPKSEQTVWRFK
jgi:hypothetical protein